MVPSVPRNVPKLELGNKRGGTGWANGYARPVGQKPAAAENAGQIRKAGSLTRQKHLASGTARGKSTILPKPSETPRASLVVPELLERSLALNARSMPAVEKGPLFSEIDLNSLAGGQLDLSGSSVAVGQESA